MIPNRLRALLRPCLALTLVLAAAACSSDKPEDKYADQPPEAIYNEASDNLSRDRYEDAAKLYLEVERQHPYSVWAGKAQLMASYSYYQAEKYSEAIDAAQRYIQLHTGSEDTAYAYYLVAISYYAQISDIRRDQSMTQTALNALNDVVVKFPNSDFARDAKLKMDLAREQLAGQELLVGRYYERREQYLAAVNRYRTVVERYQTTNAVPEALERLVECYLALGLKSEAQAAGAVLGHNYPGSSWYQDAYALLTNGERPAVPNAEGSWISRTFGG